MKLLITGTPGTGKSTLAKALGKKLKITVINEKNFALKKRLGKFEENELIVPLAKLKKELSVFLKKKKNVILEGHLLCEIKLPVDAVILVRLHPEILEANLMARRYCDEKIQDNVFCEGIDYCKKHALRNYKKEKIIEIDANKSIKENTSLILNKLKERGIK